MFHTRFCSSLAKATADMDGMKALIEEALSCWDELDRGPFNETIDRLLAIYP